MNKVNVIMTVDYFQSHMTTCTCMQLGGEETVQQLQDGAAAGQVLLTSEPTVQDGAVQRVTLQGHARVTSAHTVAADLQGEERGSRGEVMWQS